MTLNKKNLYFFFPYRGVGGVPILFLRLANYIAKLNLYNIYLIDYEDGYMAKNYDKNANIQFIDYDVKNEINFKSDDIVVFQSMPLWGMPQNLVFNDKTKLIYWNLHPYNMFGYASSIGRKIKNKIFQKIAILVFRYLIYLKDRKAIKIFDHKKSIFFMDGENFEQTEKYLNIKLKNKLFLPLIIDDIENIKIKYRPKQDELNCIWIGRIGDFKVHILLYTLKKLNDIAIKTDKKIIFNIIGTGEYLDYLKKEVELLNNIKVEYIGYVRPENLKEYLYNIDISFAMGTAALDCAKYGLPTILLDFSYEDIQKEYKFDWLYNTKNYTLGREINETSYIEENNSLENMLNNLSIDYELVSKKSFEYIENNFDIEITATKFINLINNSQLLYTDLDKGYFNMNIFHKLLGSKRYYND